MPRPRAQRDNTEFGDWLQREMRLQGLNQTELAQRLGVSHSTVSRWISGRTPDARILERLADVLVLDFDLVATKAGYRPKEVVVGDSSEAEALLVPLIRRIDWQSDHRRLKAVERQLRWLIEEDEEDQQ